MTRLSLLGALTMLLLTGCHRRDTPPEGPLPPNTILLSQMMRELSAHPGFTEALLQQIEGAKTANSKRGPALLTPALADELRKRILGKDWSGLDRFPGWTMREINPTVRIAGHLAGKNEFAQGEAAVHPGATPIAAPTSTLLDTGPYALDQHQSISLDQPSTLPAFSTQGIVTDLGAGVVRGDGPNALAAEHSESQRLADVLNRLAANQLEGAQSFAVTVRNAGSSPVHRPQDLIAALQQTGHTVTVTDSRYFANFGHLHSHGRDVMMPFWVNTQLRVPGTDRPLLVPVAHAELEWHIRPAAGAHGPRITADVSWYFGIDGKAQWRVMDTLDQAWVGKLDAHTYTGADAVEVTRLTAAFTVAYMHLHAQFPKLPFGGYYALGVCQDAVSAIEHKLTGRSTLFPNTADATLFNDARDAEVNALIAGIPKDRTGARPEPERIFGSIPFTPAADPAHPFDAITIPGLADDLNRSYAAWQQGTLQPSHGWWHRTGVLALSAAGLALILFALGRHMQRTQGKLHS